MRRHPQLLHLCCISATFDQQLPSLPDAGIIMPVSAMSRVAIAIAAHGLPGLTGILSVPIEGTHSLSLTVVRAYSAAGGGWAVQQGRGHVLATWLAMAGTCAVEAELSLCASTVAPGVPPSRTP